MKAVAVIQARMSSTRLPGKVLAPLAGLPVLGWCVRAARQATLVDAVVVATSEHESDDPVAEWCREAGVDIVRGDLNDVLARYVKVAQVTGATHLLRLTADCPLIDPRLCDEVLALLEIGGYDYASNAYPRVWPDGTDCEAFTAEALQRAHAQAVRADEREHVTSYIRNHQYVFKVAGLPCPLPGLGKERWTLDYPEDLRFLEPIASLLPRDRAPSYLEVLRVIRNTGITRATVNAEEHGFNAFVSAGFERSTALLKHAEEYIPQGSQTFSKSARQFPVGYAPLFVTHGEGGRVWDVDGNEYVDLVCGLLPIILGYADADVDMAIREQLNHGITFSLPTLLETELARRMRAMVPCAQKVRFAKNGSDVTAAAIRVARAFTGREHVMVCGYHGWQDWYIGATSRFKGVPSAVRELTHTVAYNDIEAVEKMLRSKPQAFAAMVMEPVNAVIPKEGYFAELKALLEKHGVLLIFDEVITGFRLSKGGAQQYFDITPDLACFGKAMGNGMPISALAGRADVMAEMDNIFFSGTFGGEALSLAASIAVLDKLEREPVIEKVWATGDMLRKGVSALLAKHKLADIVMMKGLAPWVLLDFLPQEGASKEAIKTLFVTQMAKHGVLVLSAHNICYSHNQADMRRVLEAYDKALGVVATELASGELEKHLPFSPVYPAFTVR